jgi:hypothetical protein
VFPVSLVALPPSRPSLSSFYSLSSTCSSENHIRLLDPLASCSAFVHVSFCLFHIPGRVSERARETETDGETDREKTCAVWQSCCCCFRAVFFFLKSICHRFLVEALLCICFCCRRLCRRTSKGFRHPNKTTKYLVSACYNGDKRR